MSNKTRDIGNGMMGCGCAIMLLPIIGVMLLVLYAVVVSAVK